MFQKNWQELIKPQKLRIDTVGQDSSRFATIIAEPLERGFGLTLGNALRRVLLSSLQGAAVTSIQIEGVLHEFSSIAGVREDVTDIVLNVKQIALRMHAEGPKRLSLKATGPGEVTAGQIAAVEAQMVFDEARNEVIAVVVAGVAAQFERLAGGAAGFLEGFRIQLLGEEFVGQALVDQDAVRE